MNAIVALNSWSVSISSVSDRSANHPTIRLAAHVATVDTSSTAGAAPRSWKRHAIHPTSGGSRNRS